MCKVRVNAEVKTESDLQNLVVSTILRQRKPFTLQDIQKSVVQNLEESPYCTDLLVDKLCENAIMRLSLSDCIRTERGVHSLSMSFPSIR